MSGVVLRCPNCGTTRAAPGECEACHEAQVRYYCTTHTPGRWLDTPLCPQCGARFGDPKSDAVRPTPAAPSRAPIRPRAAALGRKPVPAPRAAPRPAPSPTGRPVAGEGSSGRPERMPPDDFEEIDDREEYARRGVTWQDLLRHLATARRAPPDAVFDREPARPARRRLGGCLGRFLLIVVFLFLALMGGVSVLGGSLLRLFLPY